MDDISALHRKAARLHAKLESLMRHHGMGDSPARGDGGDDDSP